MGGVPPFARYTPTMPNEGTETTSLLGKLWHSLATRSPFQLLLMTPIVTVPLSALLLFTLGAEVDADALGLAEKEWTRSGRGIDRTHYFYFDFWRTWLLLMGPGVLNLLVAPWLFRDFTYARVAGALALTLALLRTFVVPLASIAWFSASVIGDAGLLIRVPIGVGTLSGISPSPVLATIRLLTTAWTAGLAMWLLTLGVWLAFAPLMERFLPHLAPRQRLPGEPTSWGGYLGRRR